MCDGNLIFVSLTLPSIFLGSPASSQLYLVTIMDEKKEEERTLTTTIMKTSHFVCLCLSGQDWPRQIFDKTRFILEMDFKFYPI